MELYDLFSIDSIHDPRRLGLLQEAIEGRHPLVLICGFSGLGKKTFARRILKQIQIGKPDFQYVEIDAEPDNAELFFKTAGGKGKSKSLRGIYSELKHGSECPLMVLPNACLLNPESWSELRTISIQGGRFLLLANEDPKVSEGSYLDFFRYELREVPIWYFPVFLEEYSRQLSDQGFQLGSLPEPSSAHKVTGGHIGLIDSFFRKLASGINSAEEILKENEELNREASNLVSLPLSQLSDQSLNLLNLLSFYQSKVPLSVISSLMSDPAEFKTSFEPLVSTHLVTRESGSYYCVPDFIRNYLSTRDSSQESRKTFHHLCFESLETSRESALRIEAFFHLHHVDENKSVSFLESFFQDTAYPEPLHKALNSVNLALETEPSNKILKLARARVLHQMDRQEEALDELNSQACDQSAESLNLKGTILLHSNWNQSLQYLNNALDATGENEHRLRAAILASLGGYHLNAGSLKESRDILIEGLKLVRENQLESALLARYLVSLNLVSLRLNAQQDADAYAQEILEIEPESLDLYTSALAGRRIEIEMERRSWDKALQYLQDLRARAASAGDRKALGDYHFLMGLYSQLRGNGQDAISHHRVSMALYRDSGAIQRSIVAHSYLLSVALEEEQLDDIDDLLASFRDRAQSDPLPKANVRALFYQVILAALTDQPDSLQRWIEELSVLEGAHVMTKELLLFFSGYLYQKIKNPWGATNFDYQPPKELVPLFSELLGLHFEKIEKRFVCCTNRNGTWQALSRTSVDTERARLQQYDLFFDFTRDFYWEREQGEIPLEKSRVLQLIFLILCFIPGKRYSLEKMFEAVWQKDYNEELDEPTVRVAINRLKKRIEKTKDRYIGQGLLDGTFYLKSEVRFCLVIPEDEISHFRTTMEKFSS